MPELKFDTGLVAYSLNGKCEVSFNPTDSAFIERLSNAFEMLDKEQDLYKDLIASTTDSQEIYGIAQKLDGKMREILDGVFGVNVCDRVFGGMNVYAMAGGMPVWANLLLAVMDEVNSAITRESKATNPRIRKYTAKYHR